MSVFLSYKFAKQEVLRDADDACFPSTTSAVHVKSVTNVNQRYNLMIHVYAWT
jgi:hypothetical protein